MGSDGVGAVRVPQAVLDGLEVVRQSGATNMLDRPAVIRLAAEFGHDEAAAWVRSHRADYARGVFNGFTVAEEEAQ